MIWRWEMDPVPDEAALAPPGPPMGTARVKVYMFLAFIWLEVSWLLLSFGEVSNIGWA